MSPEELVVYVAKLKEESLNKRRARRKKYRETFKAKYPNAWREYIKSYSLRHPVKKKRSDANQNLKHRHGITLKEKEAMIVSQNNCCPICDTTNPGKNGWHLDHCHSTKKVRSPLCNMCNHMLGYARDDVSILLRAIYYLDRHSKPVTL